MAHIALYREWRPQRFSQVVGQRHVTQTLSNAIKTGRMAHAYLLCGPRGTGKTSVARLLSRAVNCLKPDGAEPCNECATCRAILDGSSLDVIEIDAASNRGIDEIRELRERVRYAPTDSRFKVYIIDEVHMLTTEAFNALLKTLEEPPATVVFVMATTESHKVPLTILSRCQRFDFHRLPEDAIADRLAAAVSGADAEVTPGALRLIARVADGSMRDALSILEQAIAYCDEGVSEEAVAVIVGAVPTGSLLDIAEAIAEGNVVAGLEIVSGLVGAGADPAHLIRSLIAHYRDILLAGVGAELTGRFSQDELERMSGIARTLGTDSAIRCVDTFAQAESQVKYSASPRVLLEISVIKAASHATPATRPRPQAQPSVQPPTGERTAVSAQGPPPDSGPPPSLTIEQIADRWEQVLRRANAIYGPSCVWLACRPVGFVDDRLTVVPRDEQCRKKLSEQKGLELMKQACEDVLGCPVEILVAGAAAAGEDLMPDPPPPVPPEPPPESRDQERSRPSPDAPKTCAPAPDRPVSEGSEAGTLELAQEILGGTLVLRHDVKGGR